MQLNFLGLLIVGIGILLVGLGVSGNYATFGQALKSGIWNPKKEPNAGGKNQTGG